MPNVNKTKPPLANCFNIDEQAYKERKAEIGRDIAELLHLKQNKDGRYDTAWGTKTSLGIFLCIERIIKEEIINL